MSALQWARASKYRLETTPPRYAIAAYYSSIDRDYMAWDVSVKPYVVLDAARGIALNNDAAALDAINQLKLACQKDADE